jgi:hypothetical protein
MNNKARKVEHWIKARQACCPFVRWRKVEGGGKAAFTPTCTHADHNEQKCVYRRCPFEQSFFTQNNL